MLSITLASRTVAAALALALTTQAPDALAQLLAEPVTARSSVAAHDALKVTVELPGFRIGGTYDLDDPASWQNGGVGGTTLESLGAGPLKMSYIAVGTPVRDAEGRIVNAVVIPSFYSGDATTMYAQWVEGTALSGGPVVGPGEIIDTDRFYVVMFDAIGLWGASKPSEGLGLDFPQYSYFDMVQSQYRVLRDHLNVGRVALVTGVSMGATQTHLWGVMHSPSGFVRTAMPIGGATQEDGTDPVRKWVFKLATAGIESDPVWRDTGGDYYHLPKDEHPNEGVAFHWSALLHTGFDFDFRVQQPWDTVRKDVFFWDPADETDGANLRGLADSFDAVDLFYRNRTGTTYNINDDLRRSRADTLVLHVENDQWLPARLARASAERIPGARFVSQTSPFAHYAIFGMPNALRDDPLFRDFMQGVAMAAAEPAVDQPNFRVAHVRTPVDPEKSFWKDHMVYPYPVKYETGTDALGRAWEIGYMDEYAGDDPNPPTLVIVHGKGAFGGHYGNIMSHALRRGMRVIVPDLPHYGMSGPGNLHLDESRTMQNMREAIHDVVVNKLGVTRAHYYGHSLGGQFVLGYALEWPQTVESIILEGPAGLEEFPMEIDLGGGNMVALFDPALANQGEAWRAVWDQAGLFQGEFDRTAQGVEDFFNFYTRDAAGNRVPSPLGYFKRETPYARLHTDQRIEMIEGNPAEFHQWVTAFIWDIPAIAAELLRGDEDNLYRRLPQVEAPIFLAFGAEEPFIPSTPLNGLTDMANQVITPFVERMAAAGNPPVVKIYPGAGHFIHTDEPIRFPRDVVDFALTGRVQAFSPRVVDALINGAPAAADGTAAAGGEAPSTAGLSK